MKLVSIGGLLPILLGLGATAYAKMQETRKEILDARYTVEWKTDFDSGQVEFLALAQTTGFVGFGLSVGGTMNGADIVIGGVHPNGTTYFDDFHGIGHVKPVRDEQQNWKLISGTEADGVTTLRFKRFLDTCDSDDQLITIGTVKLIWALGATDTLTRHLPTDRGALAVNMLDPPLPPVDLSTFDKEEVKLNHTLIPRDAIYWCTIHKRVVTHGKSHIVAFKPILETPEALRHTHHFNMYACKGANLESALGSYVGVGRDCGSYYYPTSSSLCDTNLYAWSFGGRLLVFPDNVGYAWGETTTEYFLLQVHFDNPTLEQGKHISTGVEIYHTKNLREQEAGFLFLGHAISPTLMIPPSTGDWTIVGHCGSACTAQNIPSHGNNSEIQLFNVNLHAHKSARKMKLRHFRSGVELPWIANDETYDLDFQENRPLREPVRFWGGDHLTLECTYDSHWKDPHAIIGGASTQDEMCFAFVYYFPKLPLEDCLSEYPRKKLLTRLGVEEYHGNVDPHIQKPKKWLGHKFSQMLGNLTWSEETKAELQKELRYGRHELSCFPYLKDVRAEAKGGLYPDLDHEYKEESTDCSRRVEEPEPEPEPELEPKPNYDLDSFESNEETDGSGHPDPSVHSGHSGVQLRTAPPHLLIFTLAILLFLSFSKP